MKNAKKYKPLAYELVDLSNRQKEITDYLIDRIRETDNDAQLLMELQNYLKVLEEHLLTLKPLIVAIEDSIYKDSAAKFEKK